jgi:hypothetical protein
MRENCTSGSVQGAPGNRRSYCARQRDHRVPGGVREFVGVFEGDGGVQPLDE